MKTTEIIKRILAHPDCEDVLEKLEDRLAEESQTPAIAKVLQSYLDRDVEAMFSAFTGWDMKTFLAIAHITPDTQNLFGGKKKDALFQDIDSVEIPEAVAPVRLRVFLDDNAVSHSFVSPPQANVSMEVIQTYIDRDERFDPENLGRSEKMDDYLNATASDPNWRSFCDDANNCADWTLRNNLRFTVFGHSFQGEYGFCGAVNGIHGEFCLLDPEKLTVARWNDGYPEVLFDLAIKLEGQTKAGEAKRR